MPELLLEFFSEEIPARMQAQAGRDLQRLFGERLAASGLQPTALRTFAGPRRLTLVAEGLPAATPDQTEELKGPKAAAPPQALEGFLRKTGLTREQLTERDGVLYATLHRPGRATPEIVAEAVEAVVRGFPWPKSMRWGTGTLRWVRPLKRILCVFDGAVVPFDVDGVRSGDEAEGHRFLGLHGAFSVDGFETYARKLSERFVILDAEDRKARILEGARKLCADAGLELVDDPGLLDEVAGLAEWPVPILGDMDPAFLDLPPEVIRTSMRTHQKYFAVRRAGETERLAPHFLLVANIEPSDGGAAVAHGNARVLSARLNDARFFWDEDRKPGAFDGWLERLKGVTFHARLGTLHERAERIAALAREIAPLVGADPDLAETAGRLCKADLASQMVGEFPELQGVMGGYYARQLDHETLLKLARAPLTLDGGEAGRGGGALFGEVAGRSISAAGASGAAPGHGSTPIPDPSPIQGEGRWLDARDQIADAIRDHYKPQGPSDAVPTAPLTLAVALADKLDTLVGFFAIDERPTGSKDPYALRRAALGVIRLILASEARIGLRQLLTIKLRDDLTRVEPREVSRIQFSYMDQEANADLVALLAAIERLPFGSALLLPSEQRVSAIRRLHPEGYDRNSADDEWLDRVERFTLWHNMVEDFRSGTRDLLPNIDALGREAAEWAAEVVSDLLAFFADRLKVLLRDQGRRHDLVDAVFALGDDDLVRIVRRVEALDAFLATDDGANLLAGYKRAANILRAEQKKNPGETYDGDLELDLQTAPEEQALSTALTALSFDLQARLDAEDFEAAMRALARLRAPVDAFFDGVLVNDPDPAIRLNRLRLLSRVQSEMRRVADFGQIGG